LRRKWTYIGHELGKAEQKRADIVQLNNLQIEIEATRARKSAMERLSEDRRTAMAKAAGSEYANVANTTEITETNTQDCVISPVSQQEKITPQSMITEEDGSNHIQSELSSTSAMELISVEPNNSGNGPLVSSVLLPLATGTEAMFVPTVNQSYPSLTQHDMLPGIFTCPAKDTNNSPNKQNLPEEVSFHPLTIPNVLNVDVFSNTNLCMPAKQLAAIEQTLFHNIVNQYCVSHHESAGMMYCQPASHPDTSTDDNLDSASNNFHSALRGDAQLNFSIQDNSGNTNSVTFNIETNGRGQQEVLEMVGKYLEPLTVCFDMGWQRRSSGTSYNSMSGHAFLVGANSNKILRRIVYSKSCCTCVRRKKRYIESG